MSVSDIAQGRKQLGNGGGGEGGDYPVRNMEVGDTVVGTYVGTSSFDSKFNDKKVSYHRFDGEDGGFALRSKGNLDEDVMAFAEPGMRLEIERIPDKKTKAGYNFAQFLGFEVE